MRDPLRPRPLFAGEGAAFRCHKVEDGTEEMGRGGGGTADAGMGVEEDVPGVGSWPEGVHVCCCCLDKESGSQVAEGGTVENAVLRAGGASGASGAAPAAVPEAIADVADPRILVLLAVRADFVARDQRLTNLLALRLQIYGQADQVDD